MINDLDRTLREILTQELELTNGREAVQFEQPNREWSSTITQPTLNLFLYDLRENNVLRQHQWQQVTQQNGNGRIQQKRMPFRVECHYILTAWAPKNPNRAEDEHHLLTNAMLALFRYPELPAKHLQGDMEEQPFEISARLAAHDKLTNPAELWSALDNELRPSVSYIVTLAFDPWQEIEVFPVRTLTIRTHDPQFPSAAAPVSQAVPAKELIQSPQPITPYPANSTHSVSPPAINETVIFELHTIAGTIYKKNKPQVHLDVAVQGTNFTAATNKDGRYTLGPLAPGQYTLTVAQAEKLLQQRTITVPLADEKDNYDIYL